MKAPPGLHRLARLHGVQTAYHANDGRRVAASPEALFAALRALRVPVGDAGDIPRLIEHRTREVWERVVEPVVTSTSASSGDGASDGGSSFLLRLPVRLRGERVRVVVGLEQGGERTWAVEPSSLEVEERADVAGAAVVALRVPLPSLPPGYHDLRVEVGRGAWTALLISAPRRTHGWARRGWGVFAPLYALWERGRRGDAPSFRLLDALVERVASRGGGVVGTLPLLAAYLDRPYEPSPYAPVSRLFWNEVYVEPPAAPGEPRRGGAGGSPADNGFVDFRGVMAAKRPALESAAREFFEGGEPPELASFRARNPRADDYARFRALVERLGPWGGWADRLRARDVRPGDYDEDSARYHLYVQWLTERQLAESTERAASRGVGLYLDLPMGVHPEGYDVWRDRALFARAASAGAPPDALAPGGQDWGFPPPHPEANRLDRHRYFIASIRKHLRFARVLRIDHVMQLHRMFWVPSGDARQGVYVRYPAEELYAVLCLESHRAGAVIVGEDLGTVPRTVRRGMRRHGLAGMYVAQFELTESTSGERDAGPASPVGEPALVPRPVPAGVVASIGTHDTPTFAGWWTGHDIVLGRERGEVDPETAETELAGRGVMRSKLAEWGTGRGTGTGTGTGSDDGEALLVLRALHRHLGRSAGGLVLATMEDLWLEREPQNVPGTTGELNWRRRAARPVETLEEPGVVELLDELDQARRTRDED